MSTLAVFREMTGIENTSALEVTLEEAQRICSTLSAAYPLSPEPTSKTSVTVNPVSTYILNRKDPDAGRALAPPTLPAFACHWAVVAYGRRGWPYLLHLVLDYYEEPPKMRFEMRGVPPESLEQKATVKPVGTTKYDHDTLRDIGERMIAEFGDYRRVFWNCQMFAKCYLRVITEDVAVFEEWTSADVSNLFLCALVITAPIASSRTMQQLRKQRRLRDVGKRIATESPIPPSEPHSDVLPEEQIFTMSDRIIEKMIDHWEDSDLFSTSVKYSSDKPSLLKTLWRTLFG